jgi:histidinol-phosphatase (PHP family)
MVMSKKGLNLEDLKTRDLHVHTRYCNHAEGEMEDYVRTALHRGLDEIGFLAHAEAGIDSPRRLWLRDEDLDLYWREGNELKHHYGDQIRISLGLELGLNPEALFEMHQIVCKHSWDRLGLAYHFVHDGISLLNICSRANAQRLKEVNAQEISKRYYQTLRDHVALVKPDFICHLDVVRKFMVDTSTDPEIRTLIRELLTEMAKANVALEVNTGGYCTVGAPYPASWILAEAIHQGIELVLSSDSHKPEHVGRHFDQALVYIEDSVFTAPDRLTVG